MNYADRTNKSVDALRRFSHNGRFRLAGSLVSVPDNGLVLDFGGGDGAFLHYLLNHERANFTGVLYEPFMERNPSIDFNANLVHLKTWDEVVSASAGRFDVVFCQEVMEHFSPSRQEKALHDIRSVMAEQSWLVLSVPVEIGPVAIIKNIGRWKYRKKWRHVYTYKNLLKSLFGVPISELRTGEEYLTHMGFYFTDLKNVILNNFNIEKMTGSPFPQLPLLMNSQVFFVCTPRT